MKFLRLLPLAPATLVVLAAACGDTTSNPPLQLNLDRPVDVAFACVGGLRITNGGEATTSQEIQFTAQPPAACTIRSGPRATGEPIPVPPGQEDLSAQGGDLVPNAAWYGLILQSGPGTVALATFGTKPSTAFAGGDVIVLDADRLTPGKNSISVGEDPIAIITDPTGCMAVTANAGSCDLSVLDINSALDGQTGVDVRRLPVTNAAGELISAKPTAMVVEPASEVIGNACPLGGDGLRTATGLAYVAYPGCRLVAGIDLATGQIVTGVQYDDLGVPQIVDGTVTCPDECGAGTPAMSGVRPVAIDLELDPRTGVRRLVIGSENSASLTLVELDLASRPASLAQFALEDPAGDLGVTALAMSTVIGMGGESGMIDDENSVGGEFQFVYAVATDATVRVVDILNVRTECDTQVDPRFLRENFTARDLGCLSVGAATTPARRAGARGPGIELGRDAIPLAVDIIRSEHIVGDSRVTQTPAKLIGYFAMVSAVNGSTFVVNIDDDDYPDQFDPFRPLSVPVTLAMPHQLRDAIFDRGRLSTQTVDGVTTTLCENNGPTLPNGGFEGGPRATATPARNIPTGAFAPEKQTTLPGIRQLRCEGSDSTRAISELAFAAPEAVRDRTFPDLRALRNDENWTLTWEGSLSVDALATAVNGPAIRESQLFVDQNGMHLVDQTKPYCHAGVQPFDIVQMRGCDPALGNGDCPINYRCYVHPQSQVQGLGACMLENEADRLADACRDFLTSVRRYTVARADSGELLLMPRRVELRTTPLDGCTADAQCEALADYAVRTTTNRHPAADTATTDPRQWVCRADATRRERLPNNQRCNLSCDTSADCVVGSVCQGGNAATPDVKEGLCMEGVVPPQACVNAPQRYELRAGEAFTVAGTRSGYVHDVIADANGQCVEDPAGHPLLTGRIPLEAPPCDPTADPISGRLPSGEYQPNPCATTVTQTEPVPNYLPGTCNLANPASTLVDREAPAILFRNRGLTLSLVDPTYPGDNMCIADRGGAGGMPLDRVPLVFPGYQLSFRQGAGLAPLILPINPVFPVKVIRGPLQSIWVVDEGDFLSTSISQPSTRGKVFRLEPHALNLINVLE